MTRTINDILEYEGRCSIMKFLLEVIQDISDLNYQRRLWIEGIPGLIGDWEETMCTFFDDTNIDEFLKDLTSKSNPEFGLSAHQIEELWKLRNILRVYSNKIYKELEDNHRSYAYPKDILADARWHKVVECAKETLKAFEGYKVPTDDMIQF